MPQPQPQIPNYEAQQTLKAALEAVARIRAAARRDAEARLTSLPKALPTFVQP